MLKHTYKGVEIVEVLGRFYILDKEYKTLNTAKNNITRQIKKDLKSKFQCIKGERWFKGVPTAKLRVVS